MTTEPTLLVTGASGHLGRAVLDQLLAGGTRRIVATTRDPSKLADYAARGVDVRAADFNDAASLAAAFRGVNRALLISTDLVDAPGPRIRQHTAAVQALKAAGVQHLVYTSLTNPGPESKVLLAVDHRETEAAIHAADIDHTILRNNLYMDLLLGPLQGARAGGALINAQGNGAVGYVTRFDAARTAAAALVSSGGRSTLDVTGPELLTGEQVVAIAGETAGKPIAYQAVPVEAVVQALQQHGLPETVARIIASFDSSAAAGQLAVATDVVTQLTGSKPKSLREFLQEQRAGWLK